MIFNTSKDQLFTLIKSLTKSEKRNFKLYAKRFPNSHDLKFLQLFDVLDKLTEYDEASILKKMPDVRKRHLANLKRHLYRQILTSLRLIYINKNIDIEIREQIDFARILYGKGMYMQSLKILERIKQIAQENNQDVLHLEILEFQKFIEARHITRSRTVANKMEELIDDAERRSRITYSTSRLSNLNIQIQGWYIQRGHVNGPKDEGAVQRYFEAHRPGLLTEESMTFFEKANWLQSLLWLNYIRLDFPAALQYAQQWVGLFEVYPQMKNMDPDLYMRALYYQQTFLFFTRDTGNFPVGLRKMERFVEEHQEQFNVNSRMIAFVYLYLSKLNFHFITGQFSAGVDLISEIEDQLKLFGPYTDVHRILLFYYKFAALYFTRGDFEKALDYLNQIVHLKSGYLRDDLHINARLLQLLAHYELQNYDLIAYLLPPLDKLLEHSKDACSVHRSTLNFIRRAAALPNRERSAFLEKLGRDLRQFAESPYECKALTYLNVLDWYDSHLRRVPIEALYQQNLPRHSGAPHSLSDRENPQAQREE